MRVRPLLFLIAVSLVAADNPKADAPKKAKDKLQGYWAVRAVERDGKKSADDKEFKDLKLVFTGDKLSFNHIGKEVHDARYKLDPSKKPQAIDFTFIIGPQEGKTFHGIYALDGDDLKLCWSEAGKRPKKLTTKNNPDAFILILKRDKEP